MDIMTPVTSLELACPADVYKCHGIFICEAENEGKDAHPPAICSASFKSLPLWMLLAVLFHHHPPVMQEKRLIYPVERYDEVGLIENLLASVIHGAIYCSFALFSGNGLQN
jgi:hypothetical protein